MTLLECIKGPEDLKGLSQEQLSRLAGEIRAGRFDGKERAALLEHLRRTTGEKLAVSNPKMLK